MLSLKHKEDKPNNQRFMCIHHEYNEVINNYAVCLTCNKKECVLYWKILSCIETNIVSWTERLEDEHRSTFFMYALH